MSVTDVPANTDALDAMLADPEIRQSLAVIVANAPTLAALASMGTGLLQRGPEVMDNINEGIQQLRTSEGDGTAAQIRPAIEALAKLAPVAETVGTLGEAALEADLRTRGKQVEVGSIFALNRVLKEPEVQETLAFLVEFARVFGKHQRQG
jgi:hypothetical protein